jgi:hypothetical protein
MAEENGVCRAFALDSPLGNGPRVRLEDLGRHLMERLLRGDLAPERLRELGRLLSKGGDEDRELIGGEVEGEAHPLGRKRVLIVAGLLSALPLGIGDLDPEALQGQWPL